MDRRGFLRGVGVLATGGALSGCVSDGEVPATAPEPPAGVRDATQVPRDGSAGDPGDGDADVGGGVEEAESGNAISLLGQDSVPDDDGGLVVTITVGNDGDARSQALVQVDVRNDDREVLTTVEQFVDLPPGESTTVRFTPDVTYDEYGSHEPRIVAETPATPLPTDTATPTEAATPSPTAPSTSTSSE